jgi:hypothetical protein
MSLCTLEQLSNLSLLLFTQRNLSRGKVFFQPVRLGGTRNSDEALCSNPSESDLRNTTALFVGQFFDLFNNSLVLVKILA